MVSSTDFANSLTVDGAASSHYALQVMSVVALIFVPLVLLYQGWTYYVFRAPARRERRRAVTAAVDADPRSVADASHPRAPSTRACSVVRAPVRALLVADAALGVVVGAARARAGSPARARGRARVRRRVARGASRRRSSLLVAVVAARALAAWGFEVAGRRAAGDVISQLRLELVERSFASSRRRSTARRAPRSRRRPSPASTRSRRPSRATSRRSCSQSSCRSRCSCSSRRSTSSRRE